MEYAIIIALIAGLTQIFKQFDFSAKFTPLFAIVAGITITTLGNAGGVWEQGLWGIIAGLSAIGLYSTTTTLIGKSTSERIGLAKTHDDGTVA